MVDSVNVVLEFLRRNKFTKTEAAFRGELSSRPDLNGSLLDCLLKEKEQVREGRDFMGCRNRDSSEEIIVREIEVGSVQNGPQHENDIVSYELYDESDSEDLYPIDFSLKCRPCDPNIRDNGIRMNNFSELSLSGKENRWSCSKVSEKRSVAVGTEPDLLEGERSSCFGEASTSFGGNPGCIDRRKERKKKAEANFMRPTTDEKIIGLSRPSPSSMTLDSLYQENLGLFDLSLASSNDNEELPMPRPVKPKIVDKLVKVHWEENSDHRGSGGKQLRGCSELSGNQKIIRDTFDLVSGFVTVRNDLVHDNSECFDSDEYDDDDDVGYVRKPIEDETWFLAREIDYPSDDEKEIVDESYHQDQIPRKDEEGFVMPIDELIMLENGKDLNGSEELWPDELFMKNHQCGSVRSIGVGVGGDGGDTSGEIHETLVGGSSEEEKESQPRHFSSKSLFVHSDRDKMKKPEQDAYSKTLKASSLSTNIDVQKVDTQKIQSDIARDARNQEPGTTPEDEEAAALQEQVRQVKSQEEEFETMNLKIVHRKNRTGFEEDKNFHVILSSVIAGRYFVMENLGSAAFSKAIQAHDLHTGMDVCMKIIKNNKDFFDQGLDEIKLLKFVNKNDPADKYHVLRLYDYFYYREHLFMVCELLKANLYEFYKFNRESGGEIYFTMPRLQSISIQLLAALQFLHGLGLIHCDLKPENILVKSYSRCEVKVIDLGSSCFQTDHLCSYVQSRSYRAPEVILGLSYDEKIDIWSLGCILAELCTGNVLFPNESPATILARIIGIVGPIDQSILTKGKDTYKYFCKNHMIYERNQETSRLEYLIPKKTSLQHRLPTADQGFIDFVAYLLKIDPKKRPTASEALNHPWLSYPYEPISS